MVSMKDQEKQEEIERGEIDLAEAVSAIWSKKISIFAVVFISGLLSIFYALSLPNVYQSDAVLASKSASSGVGIGNSSQLGAIAGLAGFDLSGGSNLEVIKAMEIMKSKIFPRRSV